MVGEYERVVLELAERRFDEESTRGRTLRDRASNLIQIDLVVLGVFTAIVMDAIVNHITLAWYQQSLSWVGIAFPLASVLISMWVLWPSRRTVFDIVTFDERHHDEADEEKFDVLIGTLLDAIKKDSTSLDSYVGKMTLSYAFLTIGIVLIGILFFSLQV
jgi:hypothetical protein